MFARREPRPVRPSRARVLRTRPPSRGAPDLRLRAWQLVTGNAERARRAQPVVLDSPSSAAPCTAVGQGADRLAQAANGTKHCALSIGVGSYLAAIEPLTFPIGEQPDEVQVGSNGQPDPPARARRSRAAEHYAERDSSGSRTATARRSNTPRRRGTAPACRSAAHAGLGRARRWRTRPRRATARATAAAALALSADQGQPRRSRGTHRRTTPATPRQRPAQSELAELVEVDFGALGPQAAAVGGMSHAEKRRRARRSSARRALPAQQSRRYA